MNTEFHGDDPPRGWAHDTLHSLEVGLVTLGVIQPKKLVLDYRAGESARDSARDELNVASKAVFFVVFLQLLGD